MKKTIIICLIIIAITALIITFVKLSNHTKLKSCEDSTKLVSLTGKEFIEKINKKESFILVIEKTGCVFCEEFKPIMKCTLEDNDLTAYSIDTSKLNQEEKTFLDNIASVNGTPTTVFIVNGEEETTINRINGKVLQKDIEKRLKSLNYIK